MRPSLKEKRFSTLVLVYLFFLVRLIDFTGVGGEISVFTHTTSRHRSAPYEAALRDAIASRNCVLEVFPLGDINFIYPISKHWRYIRRIRKTESASS